MKKNVGFNEELIEQFNSQEMVMLAGRWPFRPSDVILKPVNINCPPTADPETFENINCRPCA